MVDLIQALKPPKVQAEEKKQQASSVPGVPKGSVVSTGSSLSGGRSGGRSSGGGGSSTPAPVISQPTVQNLSQFTQSLSERQSTFLSASSESYATAQRTDVGGRYYTPNPLVSMGVMRGGVYSPISGTQVRAAAEYRGYKYQSEANRIQSDINLISGYDPDTQFITSPSGNVSIKFPYAGAEYYRDYKDILAHHPETAATRAVLSGTLNVDLALADERGREKILVQYLHGIKGSPTGGADLWRGAAAVTGSSWFTITTAIAGGYGVGKVFGAGAGFLTQTGRIAGLKALNVAGYGLMAGTSAYEGYNVYKGFESKGVSYLGEGITSVAAFGAGWSSASKGFSSGYKSGAYQGFVKNLGAKYKAGDITPTEYNAFITAASTGRGVVKGFNLKLSPQKGFSDVLSVEKVPTFREYLWNKLPGSKHELFGGSISGKPQGTHDIDVMLGPRAKVETSIASDILTGTDIGMFADVKMPIRSGKIVTEIGDVKLPAIKTDVEGSFFNVMQGKEQFSRLFSSSLKPAHSGRLKDIPETIRLAELYGSSTKLSSKEKLNLDRFIDSMRTIEGMGEKHPLISSPEQSAYLYGGESIGERWYNIKVKFWESRISPDKIKTDIAKNTKISTGYSPPSPAIRSPSFSLGDVSISFITSTYKQPVSVSKSTSNSFSTVSYLPVKSTSYTISEMDDVFPSFSPSKSITYSSVNSSIQSISSPSIFKSISQSKSISMSSYLSISPSSSYYPKLPKATSDVFGGGWDDFGFMGKRYRKKVFPVTVPKIKIPKAITI